MDQCLQVRKIVDQKIGWRVVEGFRRVSIGDATGLDAGVPARQDIDRGVSDDPGPLTLAVRVRQNLEHSDGIGLLMIKAITTIDSRKMLVDPKPVEHGATEMNRFIRQDRELAIVQSIEGFANA